jgi:hypothetical protein
MQRLFYVEVPLLIFLFFAVIKTYFFNFVISMYEYVYLYLFLSSRLIILFDISVNFYIFIDYF